MSDFINPVKRAAAGVTRGHSRLSMYAASATALGVLGAAGFAVGSAPWSEAAGDAAKTVHGSSQSTAGHPDAAAFDAMATAKTQLDVQSSTAAGSTAGAGAAHQATKAALAKHAPAKHAPAKHAPAKHAPAKHAPAKHHAAKHHAAKRHAAKKAAPKKRYQYPIYDSVTPSALPHGKVAAVYANGAYKALGHQVKHAKSVLWIDTNGGNPGATVLDVEPGDATPAGAAAWVQQRLAKHPNSVAILYTMQSSWQDVKDNVAHLPKWQQDKVRYWIADPTGVQHMVPGADATQWYWGAHIDISVANSHLTEPK
jgi:hypothetical protein